MENSPRKPKGSGKAKLRAQVVRKRGVKLPKFPYEELESKNPKLRELAGEAELGYLPYGNVTVGSSELKHIKNFSTSQLANIREQADDLADEFSTPLDDELYYEFIVEVIDFYREHPSNSY